MSLQVDSLLDLFARERNIANECETHVGYQIDCSSKSLGCPDADRLHELARSFPSRDTLDISITIGEGTSTGLSSKNFGAWEEALDELSQKLNVAQPEDGFTVRLVITKTIGSGALSVYSLKALSQHFSDRTAKECFSIFDEIMTGQGYVLMACQFPVEKFGSSTIVFASEGQHGDVAAIDRVPLISKRNDVAHFAEGGRFRLVPEDFRLVFDGSHKDWAGLFDRLANILSATFTLDYSTFVGDDVLQYKINGYRSVSGSLDCKSLCGPEWGSAFQIYEWVYQGGAVSDKIGLLRNVLTLHLDEKGQPKYDQDVYRSVCSGFEIYLKRNIGQYIEIKNRLAEFLRGLSGDAREESGKYTAALAQTLGALLTFFITVFIVNAVAGKGLANVFTRDVTYLTYAFLAGSIVYLAISLFLFHLQRVRIRGDYEDVKYQYRDILDPDDLVRIFGDDKPINTICSRMRSVAVWISIAWAVVILTLGITANRLHECQLDSEANSSQHGNAAAGQQPQR